MKKLIFTLLAAMLASIGMAHTGYNNSQRSNLNLHMWDYSNFTVVIDYSKYENVGTDFTIKDLRPGEHKVKILKKECDNHFPFSSTRTIVVFNGYIDIPSNSKVFAEVTKWNDLEINRIKPLSNYGNFNYGTGHGHNNNYSSNINNDNNYNTHNDYGYNNHTNGMGGYCTEAGFNAFRHTIQNATFDSDKLMIAKHIARSNRLTARQVLEIVEMFSFESNKLKFAKFAYDYVWDTENFYIVNNGFTFSSSINSLNKYITGN